MSQNRKSAVTALCFLLGLCCGCSRKAGQEHPSGAGQEPPSATSQAKPSTMGRQPPSGTVPAARKSTPGTAAPRGTAAPSASPGFRPPRVGSPDSEGWELYEKPLALTKDNVKDLAPGHGSPEAAVVHFYGSRLRGDNRYTEVLPPGWEKSPTLRRKLDKMARWTFVEVVLVKRKKTESGGYWIKLRMTIGYSGRTKSGTDEATVNQIGGKWYVTRPPT